MTNKKSKKYACLPNPNPSSNPEPDIDDGVNTPIINENKDVVEVIVEEDFPFDKIWEMYDKKVGNEAALRETWKALSADEKKKDLRECANLCACTARQEIQEELREFPHMSHLGN